MQSSHNSRAPFAKSVASAPHAEPAWLTVSQLARRWQVGRKTVYKFIDAGALPVWKVGTHLFRIALADILRFEAQNRQYRR